MKLSKSLLKKLVKGEYNVVCGEQVFTTRGKLLADKQEAQWCQTHGKAFIVIWNERLEEWVRA